ncbi:hypothetical protein [Streptomyces rubiginosohelvolus]|uniref:hypothetical protein n=1 Tax=Streptomyces rubiginosohelvolus TaxID=67362 RepID=UPI00386D7B2F|nr:hypothetical protein OG475_34520 [Streptomyces rubiginosohelvolus]
MSGGGGQVVAVAFGVEVVPGVLVGLVGAVRGEQQAAGAGDLPGDGLDGGVAVQAAYVLVGAVGAEA